MTITNAFMSRFRRSINAVVICPIHHNCLAYQCPNCHQSMSAISGNSIPGYCSQCGHWLGNDKIKKVYTSPPFSEIECNRLLASINSLGELIAVTSSIKSPPARNRISNVLSIK